MVKTETNTTHPAAFIDQPVATPHQSRQNIGSEVPIFHRDSFPPGEAKGEAAEAGFIQRSALFHSQMGGCAAWVAKLATPTVAVHNRGHIPPNENGWEGAFPPSHCARGCQ